ncbi:hypothetical protein M407DRAFT_240797 [Tulasnella calospora MUT 4182]|uniref:Polysaccharide lyase 14 domain-containing protein n=1 Tax=Tulasnella calospora MUT 4182 TaxID=1051891 RepID=A0A0C3QWK4_9AGAM|nr:hypothetical protein M407DRAFT_240797 [Tulasnella calospora MUT 4182]
MLVITSFILSCLYAARVHAVSPQDLATAYGMQTTTVWEFPPSPLNNTAAPTYVTDTPSWGVKRITENGQDLTFVADPFPNKSPNVINTGASPSNTSATVLAVNYPQGSFSHDTGGVQFNNIFDSTGSAGYQSMILSYEVAFDESFQFVKGGKLPGLRGGPVQAGCSGGNQPNGTDCFSVRLMWRTLGSGEAYAYIPTPNGICNNSGVRCNSDGFGVSIDRATFSFTPGQWTRITMLIRLNDPTYANGELWLYYNDLLAVKMQDVYFRSTNDIQSVQGMYFSTFFGGNDNTWASPVSQNTYYRNIQLWASTAQSNVTGQPVKAFGAATTPRSSSWWSLSGTAVLAGAASLFL